MEAATNAGEGRSALDLRTEKDRAMTRRLLQQYPRRWSAVSEAVKVQAVQDLEWARQEARDKPATEFDPLAGAKVVVSVVKTLALLERSNQLDEHHADEVAAKEKDQALAAAALSAQLTDQQKIDLYIASGRQDLMPQRLRELWERQQL